MIVVVNGSQVELEQNALLTDAISLVRSDPSGRGIAVALNGVVVPRSSWTETRLTDNDKVEILTAVAGG